MKATVEDIESLFKWMDEQNYKASTHEKFRKIHSKMERPESMNLT